MTKMLLIDITVEGTTAILLNRATEEALKGKTRTNTAQEDEDPRDVCEKAIYRLDDRQIAIPGAAFGRMLREAGGNHKMKGSRKSLKYVIPAAVLVLDDLCGFYLHDRKTRVIDFEVDSRPVTIPATKGRVMRHRARLNEWVCKVRLRLNETILSESIVRQMFGEGLQQIGIGDFRPEKGGPFGTSSIVEWKHVSDEKEHTPAQKRNGDAARIEATA
jgi:hypothetical protein